MKIAVVGAGMVGVATAHALAADGHLVAVFERHASVAEGASFAPSGLAAPGLAAPWVPVASVLQNLFSREPDTSRLREAGAAFGTRPLFSSPTNAKATRTAPGTRRAAERARALYRLIRAGTKRIDALTQSLGLEFERSSGLLMMLPDTATVAQAEIAAEWLQAAGESVEWADATRQQQIEPGLTEVDQQSRAVYLRAARVGNTREWTQLLRLHAQQLGVTFQFQHEVISIAGGTRASLRYIAPKELASPQEGATRTPVGTVREAAFDAIIVCAAMDASRLLAPLGIKLPWRPIHGYSLTVPLHLRESISPIGPRAALMDMRSGVTITRLGTRVRVAGGYELEQPVRRATPFGAMAAKTPPPKSLQPLYDTLGNNFPGAVHWLQVQVWQATRSALVDGLPVVGACGIDNIWLNVGHGHHGWPLSQITADTLCALIAGRTPGMNVASMAWKRFRR